MIGPVSSIELPGGTFSFLSWGRPGAPLELLLHGFPDSARSFDAMATSFGASEKFRIAPFLRGYAPSTVEGSFLIDRVAQDVIDLTIAMSPDLTVDIIGHDWGAVATYHAIARAPERFRRAVTMAVPHPRAMLANLRRHPRQLARSWYMLFFQLPFAEAAVRARDFALIEKLWRDWSPGFRLGDAELRELKSCLSASLPAPLEYYRAIRRKLPLPPRAKIRVPTLYLHGERDGCIGAEMGDGAEQWFEGEYRRDVVPGCGHFLHVERPAVIAERVRGWLGSSQGSPT